MELSRGTFIDTTAAVVKCPRCGKNFTIKMLDEEEINKYKEYFFIKKCFCPSCRDNHLLCEKMGYNDVYTEEFEEKLKTFEYEDKITSCKYCGKSLFRSATEQRYDMSMGVDHDYDVCSECERSIEQYKYDFNNEGLANESGVRPEFINGVAEWKEKVKKYGPVERASDISKKNIISKYQRKELERRKTLTKQTLVCARCGREEFDYPPEYREFLCEYHRNAKLYDSSARRHGCEDGKATCDCCGKTFLATKSQIYEKKEYGKDLLCCQCYYDLKSEE